MPGKPDWSQGGATELPTHQVFNDYVNDFGMTRQGPTKNPWLAGYDRLPPEIANAPVQFWIYNVGPLPRWLEMGGLGRKYLRPCAQGEKYGPMPYSVKRYEVDWADLGEYKHKAIIIEGKDMVREMVVPNGEAETDLRKWGIFWSEHNPPKDEEVTRAKARLEQTLGQVIAAGDQLWEQRAAWGRGGTPANPITDIYRVACKWMNQPRPWCDVSKAQESCPGCMKPVERGAAKHDCGAILDWKRARALRLVTKEEYAEAVADGLVPGEKPEPIKPRP